MHEQTLSPRWRAVQAEKRVKFLESKLTQHQELVAAATELAEAEMQAEHLIFRLVCGKCWDRMDVRHEIIDRLAAAERRVRKAARTLNTFGGSLNGKA